jgi:hypothetical protein
LSATLSPASPGRDEARIYGVTMMNVVDPLVCLGSGKTHG